MTYKLVGQEPYQIPSNADLGTLAYQNADAINAGQVLIQNTASVSGLVAAMTVAQSQAAAGTYLFLNQVPTNLAVGQVLSGTNIVSTATVVGFVSGYSQVQPTFTSTTATTVVAMTSTYGLIVGYGVYGTGVSAGTAVSSISNTGFPVFYPVTTSTTVGSTILYVGTTTNVAVNSMVIGNNVDVGTVVTSIGTNAFVNISRPTLGTSNVGDLLTFAPTVTLNAAITANTQTQNLLFYPTITMSTPSASAVTQNTVLSAYYNPTSPSSAALVVQNGGLGVTGQSWFGSSATIVVNSNSTTPQGTHLTLSNPTGTQSTIGFTFANSAKGSIRLDSSGNFLINAANNALYYNNDLGISNTPFSFILGGSPGGTYQQVLGTTATFLGTLIANSGTISASTNTGALQVRGGAGIGGNAWIGGSALVLGGNIDLRNSTTSSIVMASLQQQGNTTIFEFGRSDIANTPGIDFHSSGGAVDYDVRVQATGGSTTTTGLGTLLLQAGQVSITNNTTATSTTTGALKVLGGVGIGDSLYVGSSATIVSNAVATSPTTGALQVLGGAGISGNIYAGGFIDAATGFYARSDYSVLNAAQSGWVPVIYRNGGSPIITSYASTVTGIIASTNTTTGALVVVGGTGIGQDLWVGGTTNLGSNLANYLQILGSTAGGTPTIQPQGSDSNIGLNITTKNSAAIYIGQPSTTTSQQIQLNPGGGRAMVIAGGSGSVNFSNFKGAATGFNPSWIARGGDNAVGLDFATFNTATLNFYAGGDYNAGQGLKQVSIGQIGTTIFTGTNATSTTTGALIVAGGAGIGRNLWVGGNAVVGSTGTSAANSILNIGTTDGIASKMLTVSDMQTPLNAAGANGILVSMYNGGGIYMSGGAGAGNVTAKYEAYGSALGVGTMSPHPVYITSGDVTRMSINSAGVVVITSTTNAISTNSGALIVQGGVGIWRDLWVGGALNVAGGINATITGVSTTATNIANGTAGAIPYQVASGVTGFIGIATTSGWVLASNGSTATWSNVLGFTVSTATNSTLANITDDPTNATPQYLTFVSASSGYTGLKTDAAGVQFTPNTNLLSAGSLFLSGQSASTSTTSSNALYVAGGAYLNSLYVPNSTVFGGPVYFNGTATYVYSTQTAYTDNILELHVPPTGVGGQWTLDDTRDIGFRFHYYNSGDQNAALVLANDTKYLEWYNTGAEGTSTFAGSSYGTFKTGAIKLAGGTQASSTQTGDLTVTGGIGIGGAVWASNVVAVNTMSNGLNSANFVARPLAGTVSQKTGMSFYGTFYNYPSDTNPRRAADIVAGFASGTWSTEFLSFNVGNNTVPNDSNLITAEQMRITTSSVIINNGYVTVSNSTNTGALQVQGGVGVGGDVNAYNLSVGSGYYLFLGGNNSSTRIRRDGGLNGMDLQTNAISRIFISDNGYINFATTTATNISSSLQATSTTTGALTVVGGVGVGGNIVSSGYGQFYGPYNESTTNTGTYIGYLNATPRMGFFNGTASQNWQIDNFSGTFRWYTPSVTRMQLDPNGNLTVYAGTNSTSTTTGSLVLGGGAGIGGDVFVGGNLTVQTGTGSSPALVFARYNGLNEQQIVSTGTANLAFVASGGGDFRFYTGPNSTEKQVQITRIASAVNYLTLTGSATGDTAGTRIISAGNDYAVPMYLSTKNYGQMQFVKGRDATTSSQFLFTNVGGLTTDASGGAFWRGRHDASPNLTVNGANVFPRMSYYFESDSLADPTIKHYYMTLGNTTSTYNLNIVNNAVVSGTPANIDFRGSASYGNDLTFRVQPTTTSTQYLQVNGAVSGGAPSIISTGTDANVNFNIVSKGTGGTYFNNANSTGFAVTDSGQLNSSYFTVSGSVTSQGQGYIGPVMQTVGTDTNIGSYYYTKGAGIMVINAGATGTPTATSIRMGAGGAEVVRIQGSPGGVNKLVLQGGQPGSNQVQFFASITSASPDPYVDLLLGSWGTGATRFYSGNLNSGQGWQQLAIIHTTATVNYPTITGSISGQGVVLASTGTDANVNINLTTRGASSVVITNTTTSLTTTSGALVVAGGVGIGGALYLGTGNLNPATPSGIVVGGHGQIFDDGNFHIHSTTNGDMWINNAAGNQLRLNNQYSGNIIMTNGVGNVQIVSTQSATSTGTGALQIPYGGAGIGGGLWVGGIFNSTNATNATSTTTGALVVSGGVAVNGNIVSGGGLYAGTGTTGVTRGQITNDGILQSFYLGDASPRYQIGRDLGVSGGAAAAFGGSQGYALVGVADQSGSAFYIKLNSATGSITTNPNLSLTATALIVYTSTQAISTTTGALQVRGGAGFGGTVYAGGGINATGTSTFKSTVTFVSPVSSASIVARMLDSDVLTFSGARGQLFSISDSFTGTIFGVYDVSGVPAIEAYDTGNVILAETFGNVGVGTTATTAKLTVQGGLQVNGIITGTSTAFFASDVNSGGKIIVNTYNTDQIWLNSPGPNYGAIGNYGSGQAWGLGWSTGNKALTWNTTSVVTIIGSNQTVSSGTGALVVNGGVGIGSDLRVGGQIYGTASTATNATNVTVYPDTASTASQYIAFVSSNTGTAALKVNSLNLAYQPGNGFFSIGTASPVAPLHVQRTFSTVTGGEQFNVYASVSYNIADVSLKQGVRTNTAANHTTGTVSTLIGTLNLVTGGGAGGVTNEADAYWSRIDVGAGASVVNAYHHQMVDSGGASAPVNQYGVYTSGLVKGTNSNWGLYLQGTATNYLGGALGIGTTGVSTAFKIRTGGTLTGAASVYGVHNGFTIASDVLNSYNFNSQPITAASYTLGNLNHFNAVNVSLGSGSTVTTQIAFNSGALNSANNNYGFFGAVPYYSSGAYNLYMSTTATNYLAGNTGIGTSTPGGILEVNAGAIGANTVEVLRLKASDTTQGSTSTVSFWNGTALTSQLISTWDSAVGGSGRFGIWVNNGVGSATGSVVFEARAAGATSQGYVRLLSNTGATALNVDQNQVVTITTGTNASTTNTGALIVQGGVGIWNNVWIGGSLNVAGTINATITGVSSTATNIQGGTAGQMPFQTAPGVTNFTSTLTVTGNVIRITSGVPSSNTSTGALVVVGGVGISGALNATTKSFNIGHPTKPGMQLRYGSLEGPEFGVYIRGKLTDGNKIVLPDYWSKLVDPDTITVDITPLGKYQKLFVKEIVGAEYIIIGNDALLSNAVSCFYTIYAERADVDKLEVES